MAHILDRIVAYKREEVASARARVSEASLIAAVSGAPAVRGFAAALAARSRAGRLGLIAEIKRASPSRGVIRQDFEPDRLATAYERGGAACLSVLTDGPSFQGDPEHLRLARGACARPVMRKDFLVDPYQVFEARLWGADAILVIMAAVPDALAHELEAAAAQLGMDVLVEVHNEYELDRALSLRTSLIGINNRDLRTFQQSLDTAVRLAPHVPSDRRVIAESAIRSHADCRFLADHGITSFLVGEGLMRHDDLEAATRALLGEGG